MLAMSWLALACPGYRYPLIKTTHNSACRQMVRAKDRWLAGEMSWFPLFRLINRTNRINYLGWSGLSVGYRKPGLWETDTEREFFSGPIPVCRAAYRDSPAVLPDILTSSVSCPPVRILAPGSRVRQYSIPDTFTRVITPWEVTGRKSNVWFSLLSPREGAQLDCPLLTHPRRAHMMMSQSIVGWPQYVFTRLT